MQNFNNWLLIPNFECKSFRSNIINMEIQRLTSYTATQFENIKTLMGVLSSHCTLTEEMLADTLAKAHLYVLCDGVRIVGCVTLSVFYSPTGRKASIEDVVVLPEFQGMGLGRKLMEYIIVEAKKMAPISLQLTSRPSRVAANILYKNLGFQPKETNCYVMKLAKL